MNLKVRENKKENKDLKKQVWAKIKGGEPPFSFFSPVLFPPGSAHLLSLGPATWPAWPTSSPSRYPRCTLPSSSSSSLLFSAQWPTSTMLAHAHCQYPHSADHQVTLTRSCHAHVPAHPLRRDAASSCINRSSTVVVAFVAVRIPIAIDQAPAPAPTEVARHVRLAAHILPLLLPRTPESERAKESLSSLFQLLRYSRVQPTP